MLDIAKISDGAVLVDDRTFPEDMFGACNLVAAVLALAIRSLYFI